MSDFVQVMKDWRRMCKFYSDKSMKDGLHSCIDMCRMGHNTACGMIDEATDRDFEDAAEAIAQWAAEHPEAEGGDMKALRRFLYMYCTAGMMLFLGLDLSGIPPKQMIMITGAMCGIVNMFLGWLEKD